MRQRGWRVKPRSSIGEVGVMRRGKGWALPASDSRLFISACNQRAG
jgi:hypothetical protein